MTICAINFDPDSTPIDSNILYLSCFYIQRETDYKTTFMANFALTTPFCNISTFKKSPEASLNHTFSQPKSLSVVNSVSTVRSSDSGLRTVHISAFGNDSSHFLFLLRYLLGFLRHFLDLSYWFFFVAENKPNITSSTKI